MKYLGRTSRQSDFLPRRHIESAASQCRLVTFVVCHPTGWDGPAALFHRRDIPDPARSAFGGSGVEKNLGAKEKELNRRATVANTTEKN